MHARKILVAIAAVVVALPLPQAAPAAAAATSPTPPDHNDLVLDPTKPTKIMPGTTRPKDAIGALAGGCSFDLTTPYRDSDGDVMSHMISTCSGIQSGTFDAELWLCGSTPVSEFPGRWRCSIAWKKDVATINLRNGTQSIPLIGFTGTGYWCVNGAWDFYDGEWTTWGYEKSSSCPYLRAG